MIYAVFGLSEALSGVALGWALATLTAVGSGGINAMRSRRDAAAKRKTAARLILEEVRVAERAAEGDDAGLLAAGKSLPTDAWSRRREQLVDDESWQVIADAFAAIDRLNAKREAQLIWRTEDTARSLLEAREEIRPKLTDAAEALKRMSA